MGGFGVQQLAYREGLNLGLSYDLESTWPLHTFQQIGLRLSAEYPFGGYDLYETRGLGPWAQPASIQIGGEFETDDRRAWEVEPEVDVALHDDGGRTYTAGLRGNWNIGSRLTLSANIEAEWENDVTAWTSNETFARTGTGWAIGRKSTAPDQLEPGDLELLPDQNRLDAILADVDPFGAGSQYYVPVFGGRDTRSLDLTVRSSITFSPGISLQFYGQLFGARGRYTDFHILQDRDTLEPFPTFPKRDAFSLSSLQVNTVLRWEYRPGSTLYLVWTQGRQEDDRLSPLAPWGPSPYQVPTGRQLAETFSIFPRNVFLIKLDYTFLY